MLYSFDVFDTLITRKTLTPKGVFLYMQEELKKIEEYKTIADDFALLRVDAEQKARIFNSGDEIGIKDIYKCFVKRCHLPESKIDELIALEIKAEQANIVAIEENIDYLKEIISKNNPVVLISDMYLSAETIRGLLCSIDNVFKGINIYVSCDCDSRKIDGSLYKYVRQKENVEYNDWIHIGDNIVADGNVPDLLGIHTKVVKEYVSNQFENNIARYFNSNYDLDSQLFLGLLKKVCINANDEVFRIGAICGGAVLYPYCEWLVNEALQLGIEKLLFMSRDGFILKRIADLIIDAKKISLKTEYIYVSRNLLRDNDQQGQRAVEYLNQFITSSEKVAFVDFDGTGKSLVNLSKKMNRHVLGFYYYLEGKDTGDTYSFYSYTSISAKSAACEIICRAPHGPVVDYKNDGGKIVPILAEVEESVWCESGLYSYIEGALSYAKQYLNWYENKKGLSAIKLGKYVMNYVENECDSQVMNYVGDFPHNDANESETDSYGPLLHEEDLRAIYTNRLNEPIEHYYKGGNIEYSIRRTFDGKKSLFDCVNVSSAKKNAGAKKVAIYAAGKYGCEAWYRLQKECNVEVVAWVDSNYQRYKTNNIKAPANLKTLNFDEVIVALASEKVFKAVKEMLVDAGIDERKITWICDYWKGFVI